MRTIFILLCVALFCAALSIQWGHALNWDEIEFFRAADWVRQGRLPHRDFWEHHTPLQWYLFAPVTALTQSTGAGAVILMRWAQLPLWIAAIALLRAWFRNVRQWAAFAAIALLTASSFFRMQIVEFRVDAVAAFLFVAALTLARRSDERPIHGLAAGALFTGVVLANIRFAPIVVITILLLRVMTPWERRWGGSARRNWIFAGAAGAGALYGAFLLATGSLAAAWQQSIVENALSDRAGLEDPGAFVRWLLFPFGLWLDRGGVSVQPQLFDPAGIAVLIAGGAMIARSLWRRIPDDLSFLAVVQLAAILFVARMKQVYHYHFALIFLLMLPFLAAALERVSRERTVLAILIVMAGVNLAAALFRGSERNLRYQDELIREVHQRTRPNERVWDGVGWALRREPAYRYWFLPYLVRALQQAGTIQPYTAADAAANPPAAVVMNFRTFSYLAEQPDLRQYFATHYLPARRNLWVPGMSARVAERTAWTVPADGDYRICASFGLAAFPWFDRAIEFDLLPPEQAPPPIDPRRFGPPPSGLTWRVDGRPVAGPTLRLRKGQRLQVLSTLPEPVGVMLIRGDEVLFRQPGTRGQLDPNFLTEYHRPDFLGGR